MKEPFEVYQHTYKVEAKILGEKEGNQLETIMLLG